MDSVVSAEVLVPPQTDPASPSSADFKDPMAEFSRRLDDIVQKHQNPTDGEKLTEAAAAAADDVAGYLEAETSLIMSSLSKLSTPEEKLQHLIRKHVQLCASPCRSFIGGPKLPKHTKERVNGFMSLDDA